MHRSPHTLLFVRRLLLGGIPALAIGGSALLAFAADPPIATIDISKFLYGPKEITVAPGTTVRWVNHDETPHTLTSAQGREKVMASKALDTDDRFQRPSRRRATSPTTAPSIPS